MIPFGWTNGWCRTSWLGHRASIANDTMIVLDVEQTERLQLPQKGGDAPIQISQIAEREEVRIQASVDDVLRELAGNNNSRGIDGVPRGAHVNQNTPLYSIFRVHKAKPDDNVIYSKFLSLILIERMRSNADGDIEGVGIELEIAGV